MTVILQGWCGPKCGGQGLGRVGLVDELHGQRTEEGKRLVWFRKWWEVQPGGERSRDRQAGASWGARCVKVTTGEKSGDKPLGEG